MSAKKTWEVQCPCCKAKLVIDAKLGVILSHEAPPESKVHMEMDLGDAVEGWFPVWRTEHPGRDKFCFAGEFLDSHGHMIAFVNGLECLNVRWTRIHHD